MNETWANPAFVCLMGCLLFTTLSQTTFSGDWELIGTGIAVLLGLLSVGLYGLSIRDNR